jgi:hypothetical protein
MEKFERIRCVIVEIRKEYGCGRRSCTESVLRRRPDAVWRVLATNE